MTQYRCLVVSDAGKPDWRRIDAPDERRAAAALAASGLVALEIRSGPMGLVERLNQPVAFSGRIGLVEQALIMSQLATLVRSGLPVDRSLDLLREQAPKVRQRAHIAEMLAQVRAGQGLAAALEARRMFPAYVVGVVRSAEQAGRLGDALASLSLRLNAVAATRRQLATALTYPAAVLVATLLSLVLVLTVVVPQFAPIFAGQEARLPALTRIVLLLSAAVSDHGRLLLLAAITLPLAIYALFRAAARSGLLARAVRLLPGVALRDQYLAAQFAGLMGTLLANGVKVVAALPLTRDAIASARWRAHIGAVEQRVREGTRFSAALAEAAFMPRTAVRLIEVGERTGRLGETCARASEIMGEAAKARIDRFVALANPVAIILLGGLVASLVAGVMLGIFSLGDFAQ